jgi:Fe-S cluster biogenesis protein NfuA
MGPANKRSLEGRIREAIDGLRPLLRTQGPEVIDLVSFDVMTGVAVLRLDGGCPDCEMPASALVQGIEAHLKLRVPEIRVVTTESAGG